MNVKLKGYILAIIAAATYGMNPLFALPLYKEGMDPDSVLFFRYLLAIPILGIMLKARGRDFKLKRQEFKLFVLASILVSVSSLTLFSSYNYMDAGIASTLLFIYPLIVALIMILGFKEKMTWQTKLCLLLVLLGIGLLYKGSDGAILSLTGCILVFLSATSYASYMVLVNKSILKDIATLKITLYVLLFGFFLFLFRVDFGHSLIIPDQWCSWGNILALAIFPTVISFLFTTIAINYIGSTPTAILGALEPVTAVVIGVTIFNEILTPRLMVGIVFIILSVTFVVAANHLEAYIVRLRKLFPRLPISKR